MQETFRLFQPTPAEYVAIVDVFNRASPHDYAAVSTWQHWDQNRNPERQFNRHVAERGGVIGGYAFSVRTDPGANKYRFGIFLLPEWNTREIVDAFFRYTMDFCLANNPTALISQTQDDDTVKADWLTAQGFRQIMRYPRSALDVAGFDAGAFAELEASIAAQGLEITSLADLMARDPNWQRNIYELEMRLNHDVPRPTTYVPEPFEFYAQREFEDPDFMPEGWIVALDGDRYIGTTSVLRSGESTAILETGLTGVDRAYRRRGLATALKCRSLTFAQSLGARQVNTSNEENNPMYQINLKLGFRALPADVDWEKVLTG